MLLQALLWSDKDYSQSEGKTTEKNSSFIYIILFVQKKLSLPFFIMKIGAKCVENRRWRCILSTSANTSEAQGPMYTALQ